MDLSMDANTKLEDVSEELGNELYTSQTQTFLMASVMKGFSFPKPVDVI